MMYLFPTQFLFWLVLLATTASSRHASLASKGLSLRQMIKQGYRDWATYKSMHAKSFHTESEETEHMVAFLLAQEKALKHNEAYERGEVSFELDAWNLLADRPFAEYMRLNRYGPMRVGDSMPTNASTFLPPMNMGELPTAVDWRDHGFVTEVKEQGQCGSCWAFSATGSLEGQHKRATGVLVSLSEQNLIDCSYPYGNRGCDGGWMDWAFQYIKDNGGIDTDLYYPYTEQTKQRCMFDSEIAGICVIGATVTGYMDLKPGDEEMLKVAVATQGPISVVIDAGHKSFQLYKSGVYDEKNCSSETMNHAVLVVGYGVDPQHGDYWIVKNSWSKRWGENGYIRMSRNKNNQCAIATKPSYPLV